MEVAKVKYLGWQESYQISNQAIELVIPSAFGIRIIHFSFRGEANQFAVFPPSADQKETWNIYGGHRLWHSPEVDPRTYLPDNHPVQLEQHPDYVRISQAVEESTGVQKEVEVHLTDDLAQVQIIHRLINRGAWPITLAPWALSVMAPGGKGIVPLPTKANRPLELMPMGNVSLWPYTDMSDPGWQWMHKYLTFQQSPKQSTPQKIGVTCLAGWVAYYNNHHLFLKTFEHQANAVYPDGGCSAEMYANHQFLEIETLGPLATLAPGTSVEHLETWYLFDGIPAPQNEADIDRDLLPLIHSAIEDI